MQIYIGSIKLLPPLVAFFRAIGWFLLILLRTFSLRQDFTMVTDSMCCRKSCWIPGLHATTFQGPLPEHEVYGAWTWLKFLFKIDKCFINQITAPDLGSISNIP